jgi:tRNA G18 (ribose-2'-O)-methylase SpoU
MSAPAESTIVASEPASHATNKRKHSSAHSATAETSAAMSHSSAASTSAAAASTAASSSTAVPASSSSSTAPPPDAGLTEEERALKRQRREERKAAVQALDEAVDPLYPGRPECRVLVYNVSKKLNIGMIVRTAVAFAATQIIVVGNRKINTLGNQSTNRYISFKYFDRWRECADWIKQDGWRLIGVEIGERAVNISTRPFSHKTIFVLGNEGQGLSTETMDACDELVYIPQYGRGTASLNVSTAASIVLHHFAEWAQYGSHTKISGYKFEVDPTKQRADAGYQLALQAGEVNGMPASGPAAAATAATAGSAMQDDAGGDGGEGGDE